MAEASMLVVDYVLPEFSEVIVKIPNPNAISSIFMKLLDGNAKLEVGGQQMYLETGRDYSILPTLHIPLFSTHGCAIRIGGTHEIHQSFAVTNEQMTRDLFKMLQFGSTFDFLLQKGIQVQVFVGDVGNVSLMLIHGAPEILGCPLVLHEKYDLPPNSTFLIDYFSTKSCSFRIEGVDRRIKVIAAKDITWELMRNVHTRIHVQRKRAMKNSSIGPKVLVLGARNVGKTSFCYFLINKALENSMKPLYVNLDVSGTIHSFPGTLSALEVEGRLGITEGFFGRWKSFIFGHLEPRVHLLYYHLLVKRMSEVCVETMWANNEPYFSGAIVEMSSSLCEEITTQTRANTLENIHFIMNAFDINMIVVVGSRNYYDYLMQDPVINKIEVQFILSSQNVEERNVERQIKARYRAIPKYFWGTRNSPVKLNELELDFCNVEIYKVIFSAHSNNENYSLKTMNKTNVRAAPVNCNDLLIGAVCGVSEAAVADEDLPLAVIKYFVYIQDVDMEKRTVTLKSPSEEPLTKVILMLGDLALFNMPLVV